MEKVLGNWEAWHMLSACYVFISGCDRYGDRDHDRDRVIRAILANCLKYSEFFIVPLKFRNSN